MTIITIDAETIPDASQFVAPDREAIAAALTHPRTYKKQETIDKWAAEEKPVLVEEIVQAQLDQQAKGGLSAETGILLAFTYAIDNDPPVCITGDERSILISALEVLAYDPLNLYVGHFITGFDLPFIRQRAWVNGLAVPAKPFKVKPWDDCIADTMLMWDAKKTISLDRLCRVLGVPSPKTSDMDGSMVWAAYQRGEIERIRTYALADVEATRECWNRMK